MKRKLLSMVLVAAVAIGCISGCGAKDGDKAQGAEEKVVITQATVGTLSSLDSQVSSVPESMNIVQRISEPLYKIGTDGQVTNGLAENVTTSEDGLTWTFEIRDGVKWSNGEPVTANDFEYSFKRLANPETGAEYAWMLETCGIENAADVCYNGADLDSLGVKATDDSTLVIQLSQPVSYLPELLTGSYFTPINQKFCEEQGDQYGLSIDNTLICGQYLVKEWESGSTKVVLEKNQDYYDADTVTVDELAYTCVTDAQQQVMAFESGEIDVTPISGENVTKYKDTDSFNSFITPSIYFISYNTAVSGLDNVNLRKAIALSIDKQSICDSILKDDSVPANYLIPEEFAFDEEGVSFREKANQTYLETDKDQGKDYWAKAKTELGINELEINLLYEEDSTLELVASFIQSELQNNLEGLTVTLSTEPKNQRVEDMGNNNYELAITKWAADYQDATTYLDLFTSTSSYYGRGNYSNATYDDLNRKVYGEYSTNQEERIKALVEQEKVLLDEAAIVPLYQNSTCWLLNPDYDFVLCPVFNTYQFQYTTTK